ncbi:MAG: hypothetical protein [Podoviridae sp. ctviO18]|nr:MAG: hypothetical protein [Podoviridae sp. ctviO18]
MSKKPSEQQIKNAIQALADAARDYRKKLNVKYTHFANWIMEPRKPMEIALKLVRTFNDQDIIMIGDKKLMEFYSLGKTVYDQNTNMRDRIEQDLTSKGKEMGVVFLPAKDPMPTEETR